MNANLLDHPAVRVHNAAQMTADELGSVVASFRRDSGAAGSLLVRGVDIGSVPPTPLTACPTTEPGTELGHHDRNERPGVRSLLHVAAMLGEPVGYAQEHGGDVVQDLYPLKSSVGKQLSTSSGTNLAFHTETAFHPYKPRYLLLLCQRGDHTAQTTLCSVEAITAVLSPATVEVLRQARFRTGVDMSFGSTSRWLTPPHPVLAGADGHEELTFDAELTVGLDAAASDALVAVSDAIAHIHTSVTLEAGDLLVIDNHRAVHGRSSFTARFDGTDRWLLRTFVVNDLAPSEGQRIGRVITTTF
jgi:L-asparagine oxygenase